MRCNLNYAWWQFITMFPRQQDYTPHCILCVTWCVTYFIVYSRLAVCLVQYIGKLPATQLVSALCETHDCWILGGKQNADFALYCLLFLRAGFESAPTYSCYAIGWFPRGPNKFGTTKSKLAPGGGVSCEWCLCSLVTFDLHCSPKLKQTLLQIFICFRQNNCVRLICGFCFHICYFYCPSAALVNYF